MAIEAELADGRILEFPDGTDPLVIQATIKRMIAGAQGTAKSGFVPAMKAGWEDLKGSLAGLAGRSGLMSIKAAEEQQARNKAEAARVFKPTDGTWFDSPMAKLAETAGGSLPYMAAPLAAGAGAAFAGAPALAAAGAAGLASATQFTGSNLARQQDEGRKLADTDLGAAALASVPQAALDVVGFKMIPGIRRIFAAAGKELTPKAAAEIAKQGLKSTLADYAKSGVKASGVEGLTEASQQVFERLQAGLALNDEAAREEYLQNFIGGAALGGALSVPGRFHERGREQLQAAQIEEQKQIKAEQDAAALAQQQEEQKAARRQDPAYAQQVADRYQKAEATYRSMLPGKLDKNADEATKFEHAARAKQAKEFLEAELKPLIPEYLAVKPTLAAAQTAQPAPPAPGMPPTAEEEAGLLFPLAPTKLQPPGPAIPTADEVEAQRVELTSQHQALDAHVEGLRDQAAQAAQAGDTETAVRLSKQFKQAEQARDAAAQQIAALPKAPKNQDLAKQLEKAKKALTMAGEAGDPDAILRAAARVEKLKSQGAELMQPGPEMEMVPAGGKSESQAEFFPKVATDTLQEKPLQLQFDATKIAVPDRGQGPARLPYDPGTDIRAMEANRLDTSKTAQKSLFDSPEMSTKVQSGVGDVSTKSRAQLVSDLQIARAAGNKVAAQDAIEGLRDLKARGEATPTADVSSPAGAQLAATMGSRLPGNVAKQQAARDAMQRAYGNFVSILNRFSKGLAKKEELDTARKQILDNLVDDIGVTRGLPLTAPEAQAVQSEAKQLLNELQTRFGDTRDVIDVGTKEMPEYAPVQERDGTFIRDQIPRPQGTANLESRRPGRQTFGSPYAAAQSIREGLEQIRNNAINSQPGVPGVVGVQTPKTTSPEALAKALETAKPSPLVERLKDNLPAFASDPARRNLAAEWLYKESIGQKNDTGSEVAAALDRLDEGGRSETENTPAVRRGLYNPGREGREARAQQVDLTDNTPMRDQTVAAPEKGQRNIELKDAGAGSAYSMLPQKQGAEQRGVLFDTWKEFDNYLASDALRLVTNTVSRLRKQLAPVEKRVAELRANLVSLQSKYEAAKARQDAGAAQATARLEAAQKQLQALIRDNVVTKMEPLYKEAEAAQLALADVESRIAANMVKFASKFSSGEYVTAATDTWEKAGADFRAALANEMANGTDLDYFSAGPVIKTMERKNEALVDLTQALLRDLQFTPDSRQVLAFLNADLALQLELNEARGAVQQTRQFLEMAPATITKATLASPAGTALRKEITAAQKGDAPTAPVKGKTLSSLASLMKTAQETRGDALRGLSAQINQVGDELDAAVAELEAAMQPARDKARERTDPRVVGEDLQAKANAERKAENDRLERLADIPGEQVTFTDLAAVADKFAELPEKVARLEAKAKDTTLPKTTQAKAKNDAKKFRTRMETLYGLVSDDPETVVAAQASAQKQLDDVKARIGAKQQAINEDGITDKVRLSRTAELYDLRSELRDLQKFVDGFGKKVKRTPRGGQEEKDFQRLLKGNEAEEGTRLAASRQGPLMKKETVAGNVRTGDLTTVGERTLSPRNPITQSGQKKAPTSTQAQRGAAKDTAYETAMVRLGELEDVQTRAENALEVAREAGNKDRVAYLERGLVALQDKIDAQQRVVDAAIEGRRRKGPDVKFKDVADEPKEAAAMAAAKAAYVPITEQEQVRKVGAVVKEDATPKKAPAPVPQAPEPKPAPVSHPATKPRLRQVDDQTPEEGIAARERWLEIKYKTTFDKNSPIHGRTYAEAARWGAEQTSSPLTKQLFLRLAEMLDGVSTKNGAGRVYAVAKPGVDAQGFAVTGHYSPTFDYVLSPATSTVRKDRVPILLHELMHAATSRGLHTDPTLNRIVTTLRERVIEWTQSSVGKAHVKKTMGLRTPLRGGTQGIYGLTNNQEFMAELYSNRQFQNMLAAIPSEIPVQSVLTRFVNAISRFFKMPTVAQRSMLAEALMVSEDVMAATKAQRESGVPYKAVHDEVDNAPPSPYAVGKLIAKERTFKDRLGGNLARAAEMHTVDMRAPARDALFTGNKRLAEQAMYYVRKNDARMPQVYSVFQHGALGLKQDARGRYVVEAGNSKSVQDVFKAIEKISGATAAEKMEKAQVYLTAKRALADPKAAFALDLGKGGATPEALKADLAKLTADPKQKAALEDMARTYADLNRGMIKFLADTGAISKKDAAAYTASDTYVPYYRVRADGVAEFVFDETKVIRLGDIRTQPYLKALEGSDVKLMPLNESITRNVMLLTDLGMRNLTTRNVAYALQDIGKPAKKMAIKRGDGPADVKALRFKQEGEEYHVVVDTEGTAAEGIPSEMVARSLEGTYTVMPSFLKAFGWAGDVLRAGVTRNPMYVARQLFRDPFAASFTGGLDRGPLAAVAKAVAAFTRQSAGRNNSTADALIRKGVVQSGIFTGDPDDLAKMSMQLAGGNEGAFNKLFSLMDRAAMRADSVTRQQLYDDVLKRTGSEMEAEMAAMEMMNFSKRGLSPTVQYFSRMIPFFNAQIQGLNVLHKALTGKATMQERLGIQQKFWDRAGMLMAGTLIYAMAMEDDDTYKNARPSDRYANWFVPLSRDPSNPANDVTIKLPIPFEVGLLMKAVPEALIDFMRGESTEQHWKAIRNLFLNQIPGGSSFMMPQLAKPLIEVGTNHSFFTGREIEGANMKGLDPQERYTARTTELAKRMSEMLQSDLTPDALKLSPLQIEHLARGYLGSLPVMAAAAMNQVFGTPNVEAPDRKLTETPLIGTSFQDRYGNGATDILYAKIKAADQAKATFDKMVNEGRKQDAKMYLADIENLQTIPMLRQAEGKLQYLSKQEKAVRNSDNTPERKRELLDIIAAKREAESRKYLDAVAAVSR
jgi:hypothetical protein